MILLALVAGACGGDDPASPNLEGFDAVLDEAGGLPSLTDSTSTVLDTSSSDSTDGDYQFQCTTERISLSIAPAEFLLYGEHNAIFPGALFQGATLAKEPPDAITLPRSGGRVEVDLLTGGSQITFVDVPVVRSGEINDAINTIVESLEIIPQRFSFNEAFVETESDLRLRMRFKSSFGFGSLSGSLSLNQSRYRSRKLVSLIQPFYTITFTRPDRSADWFDPSVTPEMLAAQAGAGNPPVYVGQVKYGRIVHILIESTVSRDSLDAVLRAKTLVGGGASVDANWVNEIGEKNIQAVVYGGNAVSSADLINGLTAGFELTQQPGSGLPIAYTLKSVKDDQVVQVRLATEYDVRNCSLVGGPIHADSALVRWDTDPDPVQMAGPMLRAATNRNNVAFMDESGIGLWSEFWAGNNEGANPNYPHPSQWRDGVLYKYCGDQQNRLVTNFNLVDYVTPSPDVKLPGERLTTPNVDRAPIIVPGWNVNANAPWEKIIQLHEWTTGPAAGCSQNYPVNCENGMVPSQYSRAELAFSGNLLVRPAYTVFLVVRTPQGVPWVSYGTDCGGSYPNSYGAGINGPRTIIYGDGINEVRAGFTRPDAQTPWSFEFAHVVSGNVERLVSTPVNPTRWHVYALRFSEGRSAIFLDGVDITDYAASDDLKTPLTTFSGARIGQRGISPTSPGATAAITRLRWLEIHDVAASDAAIATRSSNLISELGI